MMSGKAQFRVVLTCEVSSKRETVAKKRLERRHPCLGRPYVVT
jgi:hypothetical protein